MPLKNFDEARFFRWATPILLSCLIGVAMWAMPYYFAGEFTTKADGKAHAETLAPLPAKIQAIEIQTEREFVPLRPLPGRVQLLEEKAVSQAAINTRRDQQIDSLVTALNNLATQQGVAISKIDDLNKRNERMENKLDAVVSRKIE